jgi:hypothetical protein
MKTPAAAVLVVLAYITAIPAAHAWDDDVRSDWRRVERDRTRLHSDYARLREEEHDIAATERRENTALRHGRLWQAWRAERAERREEADIRYLRHKIARDRAELWLDRAELRRDRDRRRRYCD